MANWQEIRQALIFTLATACMVAVLLSARAYTGTITTIWLPAGIAMAAYYLLPERTWPLLTVLMVTLVGATFYMVGLPPLRAAAVVAGLVCQSMVCAGISTRVLSHRDNMAQSAAHIAGLFGAAIIGSLVSATITLPFHEEHKVYYFAWWTLSNIVGILSTTSIAINLWRRFIGSPIEFSTRIDYKLVLTWIACGVAAAIILQVATLALFPLLIFAVLLAGIRFGQLGSSTTVLAVGLSSFAVSLATGSPVPGIDMAPGHAGLVLQGWMIMMLAVALPLSAVLLNREALERELRSRNHRLHENITILGLAEQLAGIGRYRIDLQSGKQDWSPHMLELHGLPRELAPDPGDLSRILPDKGERLFAELEANKDKQFPYAFDYHAKPPEGPEHILRMSILNEFNRDGERIAVLGVAIDVTDQIRREEALDLARGRAVRLAAEAQKIANTDALTGLPNRRCTFARLQNMVETAEATDRALAAVMFDIDHFKQVNDSHGHQAGDEVLVKVAELARKQTRSGDLVGRIGGEEFVWLLPAIPPHEVRRLAERLRSAIEKGTRGHDHPHVTASIGLAMYRPGDTEESLLARADAALYEAKDGGRNQVRLAA